MIAFLHPPFPSSRKDMTFELSGIPKQTSHTN